MFYLIRDKAIPLGDDPFNEKAAQVLQSELGTETETVKAAWNRNGFHPFISVWCSGEGANDYTGWRDYLITDDLKGCNPEE